MTRTSLRWRLTLVYAGVACSVGLLLLLTMVLLTERVLTGGSDLLPERIGFLVPGAGFVPLQDVYDRVAAANLRSLVIGGSVALLASAGVGALLSYVLAGRVLRPLQEITAAARRLSVQDLDARIALPGPDDELKELADTFDAMLDRLQASFEGQRRFVADASHELRTPLAVMRTEVDVALADPDATVEDLRAAAVVVRDATTRADRLVDSLLLLARSDRLSVEGLPETERVELSAVVAAGLAAVHPEIETAGLRVDTEWRPAAVLGDPALLERLAGNLVENAVRHNVAGGWVHAATRTSPQGRAQLVVANGGPLLDPDAVEPLFEPFRRHGTARTARRGAGLGLSIVRAVAEVHGGTVVAAARPDGGLTVTVDLPAQA